LRGLQRCPSSLAPHWFSAPALAFHRPSRCSRRGVVSRFDSFSLALLPLARVQSLPQAVLSRSLSSSLSCGFPLANSLEMAPSRPSHGVSLLSATSDTGSDLHRVYPTRLCCVLRFSQPLDASFRPNPLDPISCRCHPGSHLQRFSLHDSLARLTTRSAPLAVHQRGLTTSPPQLQGLMHSRSPYLPGRCYPNAGDRSSLDVHPFEVSLTQSRLPYGCLLSWASARRRSRAEALIRRRACSAEFQRTEESTPSFEAISLRGIFSPASAATEVALSAGLPSATLLGVGNTLLTQSHSCLESVLVITTLPES